MGTKEYRIPHGKGYRGFMAVPVMAVGFDRAGRRAEHGIPEPQGKQRGCRSIPVPQVSESMKRSEFHV